MALYIFFAFIAAYGLLLLGHIDKDKRASKLFMFGLLISILYASVYSVYAHAYLLMILVLTSLAVLTQYFHIRAVSAGKARAMKPVVDVTREPHWEAQAPGSIARSGGRRRPVRAAKGR